jgi:hypothetical protein
MVTCPCLFIAPSWVLKIEKDQDLLSFQRACRLRCINKLSKVSGRAEPHEEQCEDPEKGAQSPSWRTLAEDITGELDYKDDFLAEEKKEKLVKAEETMSERQEGK